MSNFDAYLNTYGSRHLLPFTQKTFRAIGQTPIDEQVDSDRYDIEFPLYGDIKVGQEYDAADHSRYLCKLLDWWVRTPDARLIITTPPRHGKSELCTVRLPAFLAGRFPGAEIVGGSYSQGLINTMSRKARNIMQSETYKDVFPKAWINPGKQSERMAVEEWECPNGSKFKAVSIGTGIGTGLTGYGIHFGIIDDPHKGRKEAESLIIRDGADSWYISVFTTRLHPGARILVIMTRWHLDDLAGRRIKDMLSGSGEKWIIINLPAIAKTDEADKLREQMPTVEPLSRKLGDALWPARFPIEWLNVKKGILGAYEWSALYDGDPVPPGGELIDSSMFKIKGHALADLEWVRFVDPAVSTKTTANSTASIGMAMDEDGNIYIRDLIHGQWNWPQARKIHLTACKIEGPKVRYGMEDAGQQKALIDDIHSVRAFDRYPWAGYPVVADKKTRALPWIAKLEAGKFYMIVGRWNQKVLDVAQLFTGHGEEDDDIIDAISGAYQMLVGPGPKKKKKQPHIGWA